MFHGGQSRYSLTCERAKQWCKDVGSVMASLEVVDEAFRMGFDLCVWCWVEATDGTCRRSLIRQPPGNVPCGPPGTNFQYQNPNSKHDVLCMTSLGKEAFGFCPL